MINMYHQQLFFRKVKKIISEKEAGYYTLACVNIDNFKIINEQYGKDAADAVLRYVADCIDECMINVGGISGHAMVDEFLLLYPTEFSNSKQMKAYYAKACAPVCLEQKISLRIGKYLIDNPQETLESMYYRAQIAADHIRGDYERNSAQYNEAMKNELLHKQQIVFNMDEALRKKEFEVWLQPQYNHATGAVIGAEALVRWKRDGNYIPPSEFIGLFEESGFIYQMDKFVWESVCALLRRWMNEGRSPLPLSVNISRRDMLHDDFIDTFTDLTKKYEIPKELLRIEITESALAGSADKIMRNVNELIRLGYVVEIDDFGSGYSSLNTLKDVPASVLKLDMRFFEKTQNAERAGNIIESVVRMARWLGMAVIAEGVEEKAQADFLKSIGCHYIQGYYYAKPMPIADFEAWIENSKKECSLNGVDSIENFESNEFWNPKSMETLIFNSYIGGACIFEYYNGNADVLRINDEYIRQFHGMLQPNAGLKDADIMNYLNEDGKRKFRKILCDAIASHKETGCELEVSDGTKKEYLRVAARVLAQAEERSLFYVLIANVTEKYMIRRNEQIISKQLQAILNNIQEGVIATVFHDKDHIDIVYTNESFYRLYGFTKEQYEQEVEFINDLILPEDRKFAEETVAEIVRQKKCMTYEYRCRRRDGSIIRMRMTNSLISMEGIEESVLLGVMSDAGDEIST